MCPKTAAPSKRCRPPLSRVATQALWHNPDMDRSPLAAIVSVLGMLSFGVVALAVCAPAVGADERFTWHADGSARLAAAVADLLGEDLVCARVAAQAGRVTVLCRLPW